MKPFKPGNDRAFTVLELMVVVAVVAALAMFGLASLARAREKAKQIRCISHLKQIGLSFRMWAGDCGGNYPMQYRTNNFDGPSLANGTQMFVYFQVMSNELNTPMVLRCPADKTKTVANDFPDFNCRNLSYFIGLDAREDLPQAFLAGDSNIRNGTKARNGVLEVTTNQTVSWTKERHGDDGDVALGDGSVLKATSARLNTLIRNTGLATNRLVLPEAVK